MRVSGPIGAVITAAAQEGLVDVVSREPNLEDVFLAHTATTRSPPPPSGDHRHASLHLLGPWSRVAGIGTNYGTPSATAGGRRWSSVASRRCS